MISTHCSTEAAPENSCPTSDLERLAKGLWRFRYVRTDGKQYCAILDVEKFAQNTAGETEKGVQPVTCPTP